MYIKIVKMHTDKRVKFYSAVKRLMQCGSVRPCHFDGLWTEFNTTNGVVSLGVVSPTPLALKVQLTFWSSYLHTSLDCVQFYFQTCTFLTPPVSGPDLTKLHNKTLLGNTDMMNDNTDLGATDGVALLCTCHYLQSSLLLNSAITSVEAC